MFIISFLPNCISNSNQNNIDSSIVTYILDIDVNQQGEFFIFAPYPLRKKDPQSNSLEVLDILDNLEILDGKANLSLIETKHGSALNISGSENISIRGSIKTKRIIMRSKALSLSLTNHNFQDKHVKYWSYAEKMNKNQKTSLFLNHIVDSKQVGLWIDINAELSEGWNQIDGSYSEIAD
jgi:hypothetical protein